MQHITFDNVQSFCRTCLKELNEEYVENINNPNKYEIYSTKNLAHWYEVCTALRLAQQDELPKFVCLQCYEKLRDFNRFRKTCLHSWKKLVDLVPAGLVLTNVENKAYITDDYLHIESPVGDTKEAPMLDNNKNTSEIHAEPIWDPIENSNFEDGGNGTSILLQSHNINENYHNDVCGLGKCDNAARNSCCSNDCYESEKKKKIQTKKTLRSTIREKHQEEKATVEKKFEVKFQCDRCPRRCISQENLDAHKRIHLGLKPFQCPHCDRSFNKGYHQRVHIRECHGEKEKEIQCSYEGCDKVFRHEASYRTHYRIKHAGFKPTLKTYMCEDCGRVYKNLSILREHRYRHAPKEEYPYKCEFCGKRFVSPRTYKEHLLRHEGVKKFECPYCGMKKTTRNELRTHINYHTKERQWPCPHCNSVFNSSANLHMHDRVVHKGIRQYTCRFCEQSFGKPDTLKHHEMRHTGEKPHVCQVCNKAFIQSVALRTHMKTHNKAVDVKVETATDANS